MTKRILMSTFTLVILSVAVIAGVPENPSKEEATWRLADGTPVSSNATFTPPKLIALPQPKYPSAAGQVDSEVAIEVIVGIGGRSAATSVLRADAPDLVAFAIEAAEQAQFKPAVLNGSRVAVRFELRFARKFE
jgi:outer membrane biosynthesis protein TonB